MIENLLTSFAPITLKEMSDVRLLNRIDCKYVTTVDQLEKLLELTQNDYYAQDYNGRRMMPYHTVYLDTPDFQMYRDHQRGKKHRFKVRMRMYENEMEAFMEVKDKSNRGRTKKKRIEIPDLIYEEGEMQDFVEQRTPYKADGLIPTIENRFLRITLVNKAKTERLTIDLGLHFHNLINDNTHDMPQHVIIELKRDGRIPSPAIELLRQLRIKKQGFSKMAIGFALTTPEAKQNLFKQRIHQLNKLTNLHSTSL